MASGQAAAALAACVVREVLALLADSLKLLHLLVTAFWPTGTDPAGDGLGVIPGLAGDPGGLSGAGLRPAARRHLVPAGLKERAVRIPCRGDDTPASATSPDA